MGWPSLPWFYTSWGSGPWNRKGRAAGTRQKICHIYRTIKKQRVIQIHSSLQFFSMDLPKSRAVGLTPAGNSPQHFPKFTLTMWRHRPFSSFTIPSMEREINSQNKPVLQYLCKGIRTFKADFPQELQPKSSGRTYLGHVCAIMRTVHPLRKLCGSHHRTVIFST